MNSNIKRILNPVIEDLIKLRTTVATNSQASQKLTEAINLVRNRIPSSTGEIAGKHSRIATERIESSYSRGINIPTPICHPEIV